jgi:hypothetical protein
MKQEILNRLNEIIVDEKGQPVTMKDLFTDSELDSLGTILTIATLEADYPFLPIDGDAIKDLDIPNLTIRELIKKCVSSITNIKKGQNTEMAT